MRNSASGRNVLKGLLNLKLLVAHEDFVLGDLCVLDRLKLLIIASRLLFDGLVLLF